MKINKLVLSLFLIVGFFVINNVANAIVIVKTGGGDGVVTSTNDSSLNCGTKCSTSYSWNTNLVATANDNSFARFEDPLKQICGFNSQGNGSPIATCNNVQDGSELKLNVYFGLRGAPTITADISSGYSGFSAWPKINSNGSPVSEYGLVWSKSPSPTINLSTKVSETAPANYYPDQSSGTVSVYSLSIGSSYLEPNTTYYVRAYATNSFGTSYSDEFTFKTGLPNIIVGNFICDSDTNNCSTTNSSGVGAFSVDIKNNKDGTFDTPNTPIESRIEYNSKPNGAGTTYTGAYGPVRPTGYFCTWCGSYVISPGYMVTTRSGTEGWDGFRPIGARHDTVSFRVCADPDNKIAESNEEDNCSPWKNIYIKLKPQVSISANPTGGPLGMKSTLNWSSYNDPASCTASGDWSGAKSFSGSEIVGPLNEARTYSYSISCSNDDGEIGSVANVTVCPSGQTWDGSSCVSKCSANQTWDGYECITNSIPSGSISVSPSTCTIKDDDNTCPVSLTWTTKDLIAGKVTAVTKNNPDNTTVSNQTSGNNVTNNINYGSTRFFLYHDGKELASTGVITASCGSNSSWDTATSKCKTNSIIDPNGPSGTLSVTPSCNIGLGKSSCSVSLNWTTKNLIVGKNTAVTTNRPNTNTPVSTQTSGSNVAYTIYKGQSNFYLYHDGKEIAPSVVAEAVCVSGTSWDDSKCVTGGDIVPPSTNSDLKLNITYKGENIRKDNSHETTKVPYNSIIKVSWSSPLSNSCSLSSQTSISSLPNLDSRLDNKTEPYTSASLKRNITYTLNCKEADGTEKSDYVQVLVLPISTGYIES